MEDDIIAYLDYVMCRTEFENDEVIWGKDAIELNEDENSPKMTIQEKYKDELLEDIPY